MGMIDEQCVSRVLLGVSRAGCGLSNVGQVAVSGVTLRPMRCSLRKGQDDGARVYLACAGLFLMTFF
jgi:hypothetical protein